MVEWDDVRFFLAVARKGSVRAAAEQLVVNHSTVLRRIAQLEERLGTLLFEKRPSGYQLTRAGNEVLELAEQMEASSLQLETRIFGRDQALRGPLRVTLPPTVATYLLMPDLAEFARLHPEVEMEIFTTYQPVNLTKREADVAIRMVADRAALPQNLHALKGPELFGAIYMSRALHTSWRAGSNGPIRWIIREGGGVPDWATEHDVPVDGTTLTTTDAETQILATRESLGITTLSCFVGDADPLLVRAPGTPVHLHGALWLLTHAETRKTKRVRLFTSFMSQRLATYAPLLAGQRPRPV